MPLVKDLPHWPPRANSISLARLAKLNLAPNKIILKSLVRRSAQHIVFLAHYEGELLMFDFDAPDQEIAERLVDIFVQNMGCTLDAIGLKPLG
jgi:hypothetical protein